MHPVAHENKAAPQQSNFWPLAALLLGNVALAFGPWFVRLADVGPVAAAFWRISLATPVLVIVARAVGGARPFAGTRALLLPLALGGVTFAGDLASWHVGIHLTKLANATLFGNVATFLFPLYGFVVARAWPTRTQGAALLLAFLGAALLMGRSAELSSENLAGDLLCLLAGVLYAVYFVFMAQVRVRMAPVPALALSTLASVVPLWLSAAALGERIVPHDWAPLVGLALVSQLVGQCCMIYALGRFSPLVIGLALLIQPVVAATIGWFAYDERLGAFDLAGAVLIAVALVLVREKAPPEALAPDPPAPHKIGS